MSEANATSTSDDPIRDLFDRLMAPFDPSEVRSLRGRDGTPIELVTYPALCNRLDDVLGPDNWSDETIPIDDRSFLCNLRVTLPNGKQVARSGLGADAQGSHGAFDAFRCANSKLGPGRYLARDGIPCLEAGASAPALSPNSSRTLARPPEDGQPTASRPAPEWDARNVEPPRTGPAVFARIKDLCRYFGVDIIREMNKYAEAQGYGWQSKNWAQPQVDDVYRWVRDRFRSTPGYRGEFEGEGDGPGRSTAPDPEAEDLLRARKRELYALAERVVRGTSPERPHYQSVKDCLNAVAVEDLGLERVEGLNDCRDADWVDQLLGWFRARTDGLAS